jgi:hypothetical protein
MEETGIVRILLELMLGRDVGRRERERWESIGIENCAR